MQDLNLDTTTFDESADRMINAEAQLKLDYEKETQATHMDSLTGLFNHGFFKIILDREVKRSKRYGMPFTLGFLDIDSFSIYNEQHGPGKGDWVLKEVAGIIRNSIRKSDIAARYYGDVFAVLMIGLDAQSAQIELERIRKSADELIYGRLTISTGLATCPQDALNTAGLLSKAQWALNEAKTKGKNRTCVFSERLKLGIGKKARILVVDDEPLNLKLMAAILKPLNYEIIKAAGGQEALSALNRVEVDLVLLDVMMPGMDGYEVCRILKSNEATRLMPIIMITALDDLDAKVRGIEAGADDFITKPPNRVELMARVKSLLKINFLNRNLTSVENVLIALANAVESKDAYTQGHIFRVSNMAVKLGKSIGLSDHDIDALRIGGILHDIGKIGVPREVLNKPGPLDSEEWEMINGHPVDGYKICLPLKKTLGEALHVIRHHHEKIDGSGYPDGLKGDDISRLARIMTVVDIYDALITERPYRKRMSIESALGAMRKEADDGKLDNNIVEAFIAMIQSDVTS